RRTMRNSKPGSARSYRGWPNQVTARAHAARPMRYGRIVLGAFLQGLGLLGWTLGRNLHVVRIETRWTGSKADDIRRHAQELAVLAPDVILAHGGSTVRPLLQSTHSIPIVFTIVTDPVGNGYVESLARPGRNATGFMINDYSLNAKYPELLKEI